MESGGRWFKSNHTDQFQGDSNIAFSILNSTRIKRIIDILNPRFVGRDQDHLLSLADEAADAAYDAAVDYVEPLFDFRTDLMGTGGADLVGIADAGAYFTGTSVEDALQEIGADLATPASVAWGSITGTLSNQTDLNTALGGKAATVHTHAISDTTGLQTALDGKASSVHSHTVADTTGLQAALDAKAPLASPVFTGNPTAPTPATADNDTSVATTAFVKAQGYATDTLVVHIAGTETITGSKNFSSGITFTDSAASSATDFSKHVRLHSSGYGLNFTTSSTNLVAGTGGAVNVHTNGSATAAATFLSGGEFRNQNVIRTQGASAGYFFQNRSGSEEWAWYNAGNITRLFNSAADVVTIDSTGQISMNSVEVGYKDIPRTTSALTRGQMFATAAGVTVNTASAAGATYSVYNDSAAAITLTQGAGVTMRLAGTATTGSRTLAARGFATIWFNSTSECIVSGNVT